MFDLPLGHDTPSYMKAATSIIYTNYDSFRPPAYPLLIALIFLLIRIFIPSNDFIITYNSLALSARLASLVSGVLLIVCSYYVFSKAAMRLLSEEKKKEISKYIGFIVSFFLSFSFYFIGYSAIGMRECFLSVLIVLLFYFIIIKEQMNLKDNLSLAFLISWLTLTLLTAGLLSIAGLILFYIISKIKRFQFKFSTISKKKLLLLITSFLITFLFWVIFSIYKWDDPFYNWQTQTSIIKTFENTEISSIAFSLKMILETILHSIIIGIPKEFRLLFKLLGFIFSLIFLYVLLKNFKKKPLVFIFFFVGTHFAFLSIFYSFGSLDYRFIMYFFPLLIFLGALPLGRIFYSAINEQQKNSFPTIILFLLFFLTLYLRGLSSITGDIFYRIYIIINELTIFSILILYRNRIYYSFDI
ncbi:MAG: membrane protein of unknown function [Promethearchaeota archaeon]|nr:MAG: membrane protein of unknown function [Candidatus Lokiarchaeota archaeon]